MKSSERENSSNGGPPAARRRRRWRAGRGGSRRSAPARLVEELEAELALAREENARLKVERARARERPVGERVRELLPAHEDAPPGDEDAWELMAECLVLRDQLVEACAAVEQAMRQTRRRLETAAAAHRDGQRDGLERVA
jgi:hypothetical protein